MGPFDLKVIKRCTTDIDENYDEDTTVGATDVNYYYVDFDSDGFGNPLYELASCFAPQGYVENDGDCNDLDDEVHPFVPSDPHSELCNGQLDLCENDPSGGNTTPEDERDDDGDGYVECSPDVPLILWEDSSVTILGGLDCDPTNGTTFPNNLPNEDDPTLCYQDADGDGYGESNPPTLGYLG